MHKQAENTKSKESYVIKNISKEAQQNKVVTEASVRSKGKYCGLNNFIDLLRLKIIWLFQKSLHLYY
jgi:hypothetical protein